MGTQYFVGDISCHELALPIPSKGGVGRVPLCVLARCALNGKPHIPLSCTLSLPPLTDWVQDASNSKPPPEGPAGSAARWRQWGYCSALSVRCERVEKRGAVGPGKHAGPLRFGLKSVDNLGSSVLLTVQLLGGAGSGTHYSGNPDLGGSFLVALGVRVLHIAQEAGTPEGSCTPARYSVHVCWHLRQVLLVSASPD